MRDRREAGYSLSEVLVVVAIIGILSLITVPAFMNFQRSAVFKSAMRTVATDLRGARTNAIKTSTDIRVEFTTGSNSAAARTYRTYSSTDGTTWTALNTRRAFTAAIDDGIGETSKTLSGPVWFSTALKVPDIGSDGKFDIVFHPNGTADIASGAPAGALLLTTNATKIFTNRYYITVTASGQVKTSIYQCSNGVDDDNDNAIDYGPDSGCTSATDATE